MFRQRLLFFRTVLLATDVLLIAFAWLLAYHLRLTSGLIPVWKGVPPLEAYLFPLVYLLPIWVLVSTSLGLYNPRRTFVLAQEGWILCKVSTLCVVCFTAASYLLREIDISRLVLAIFWGMAVTLPWASRMLIPHTLRQLRRNGTYVRRALLIGNDDLAHQVIKTIQEYPEAGLTIVGVLAEQARYVGTQLDGLEVMGTQREVGSIIHRERIDQVIIALPFRAYEALEEVLVQVQDEPVEVMLVPDLSRYMNLRCGIEDLGGIPALTLQGSPLYGWNAVLKRALDLGVAVSALVTFAPFLVVIAMLIKISSRGPVLYRQERMGLDCRPFLLLKFRSMQVGAEPGGVPVWSRKDDPRRTWIGGILRRTSLDELPQLINVLRGEMSLVGPRPERPEFIAEFRRRIPHYMLRHKIQAGMTGWAQIHGFRGDTSIEKRLRYDLEYIQRWSLLFDLKIMALTLVKGFVHKNAH
jgi:Undecaprenyl-phosphate glucose phosphotransferase